MTTSDDQPVTGAQDTTPAPGDDLETMHAEPMGDDLDAALAAPAAPAAGGAKRWLLAIAASLVAIVVGSAVWAGIYDWRDQEYVGVSVVIGLAVGWLMRVVTKRSDLVVRLVAILLTALGIAVGMVVAATWFASSSALPSVPGFWELLPDVIPDWWDILTHPEREPITYIIFGAALLLAYLMAGPQSGKKKAAVADDDVEYDDAPLADPLADPMADPMAEPTADSMAEPTAEPAGDETRPKSEG